MRSRNGWAPSTNLVAVFAWVVLSASSLRFYECTNNFSDFSPLNNRPVKQTSVPDEARFCKNQHRISCARDPTRERFRSKRTAFASLTAVRMQGMRTSSPEGTLTIYLRAYEECIY
jgi:hypothetical protein